GEMERGVLQHERAKLNRELVCFRGRRSLGGSGGSPTRLFRQDSLEIRAVVRSNDDAGLEAAPIDLLHMQLVGLQVQVDAAHAERIPLHEFLEEHLVSGDEVGEAKPACELDQRGTAAGRSIAQASLCVESSAGNG